MNACAAPLSFERLMAYWQGELDPAEEAAIEDHSFGCATCTDRLDWLSRLGAGITALVTAGKISASVTGDLLARLQEQGARIRTYRLTEGQTVACTAGPTDHFVAVRIELDVAHDETVDVSSLIEIAGVRERQTNHSEDVLVDRALKEAVFLFSGDRIRAVPRSTWTMHANVRGPRGDRRLGPFVLDHTPWEDLPPAARTPA